MSNIDKQDVQAVADLKAGYTLGHADVAILNELARIALASLEAEAVCVIDQANLDYLNAGSDADVWPASRTEMGDVLLYRAAPPAPVSVPVALNRLRSIVADPRALPRRKEWISGQQYSYVLLENVEAMVDDACRAAMLQGADGTLTNEDTRNHPEDNLDMVDHSGDANEKGNSPVIPDGSEDTKRLDWLDAQNKRLNEYYGTSYGWKFDANFQRNAMMLNDSNYPVMTVRQAIDQAIASAPQQEAKNV